MAKRCSHCYSRKCDGGPFCARNRKPRDRSKENAAERARRRTRKIRQCRRGHMYEVGGSGCVTCRNDRLRLRAAETRSALRAKPSARNTPPLIAEVRPPHWLTPDELAVEREASKVRQKAKLEAALERCRRLEELRYDLIPMWKKKSREAAA